jgi:cytoskeleton protein RodZ
VNAATDMETAAASAAPRPATAGARLKAAREAAGLSVDAVARQLKLAPRQVKAIEDDDWPRLPGRTFVRGFARNYARCVQLDPDAVMALLPAPDTVPALERPTLAASRRPMGEIPVERVGRRPAARWLTTLLLIAIIAAVAIYEFSRPPLSHWLRALTSSAASGNSAVAPAMPHAATVAPDATPGTATSALPNPVSRAGASQSPASTERSDAAPAGFASTAPAPAPATASTAPATDAGSAPGAPTAPLVLTFRGTSWVEVKDATGRVVAQMTGGAGMTQTVTAVPPLELALGNAPAVNVTFRGQPLDLSPYMRGSVARVALK